LVFLIVFALALAFTRVAEAQAPSPIQIVPGTTGVVPLPAINLANFGAVADAQISNTSCNATAGAFTVACGSGTFTLADIGKSIEIPSAGGTLLLPATQLNTITGIAMPSGGKFKQATLNLAIVNNTTSGGVNVTWGTDNSAAFTNAAAACPMPSNGSTGSLGGFNSKGCVLYVPNPGSTGTGDYMFGSGVTFAAQTSFQIIGMGNSGKWEQSVQAGVRFLTAMPITILTVGTLSGANNNLAGFQISNITFKDTSGNGSAFGGLDMIQISEAVIAYCSFEDFNGSMTDPANGSATLLSYGMKSDPGTQGGFSNNIVLLHDKGKDNAVFYDGSNPSADGPIVIGGDIFPTDNLTNGPCYGFISGGTIRLYGTHFDVGSDKASTPNPCYGLKVLGGGIVSAKFESTAALPMVAGNGILLQGGNNTPNGVAINGAARNTGLTNVTLTFATAPNPAFQVGQLVNVTCVNSTDNAAFGGTFVVGSMATSPPPFTVTYDQVGTGLETMNSNNTCTATGRTASVTRIDAVAANVPTIVTIGAQASNNQMTLLPSFGVTSAFTDLGGIANDIQVVGGQPAASSTMAGANAVTAFSITGANGGATTNSGSAGGNAGPMSITLGGGGTSSTGTGGNGGVLTVNIGGGGSGSTSGTNGEVVFRAPASPNANLFTVQNSVPADQVYVDSTFGLNAGAGKFNVNSSGQIAKCNNLTTTSGTGGGGVPAEVNFSNSLNLSSSITTAINLVNPTAGSVTMYRVSVYLFQAGVGVGCTGNANVTLTLSWTDPGAGGTVKTVTTAMLVMGNAPISALAHVFPVFPLVAQPSTTISYTTAYTAGTGCSTAPTYSVYLMTEQL